MTYRRNRKVWALVCMLWVICTGVGNVLLAQEKSNIVAGIGDYTITVDELGTRLMKELRPYDPSGVGRQSAPVTAKMVLEKMLGEKAMTMEARKLGFLKRDMINVVIKQRFEGELVSKLLREYLQKNLQITEAEIQEMMKADPKLDVERAKRMVQMNKSRQILDKYYKEIIEKFHAKKHTENFAKAAGIYERLLLHPKKPRDGSFVRLNQISGAGSELTAEEQSMVLASYDGGQIALLDWFKAICNISPPSRPTDLAKPEGVEAFLERMLKTPLIVTEARSLGLDKDEQLQKSIRQVEDSRLLGEMMGVKSRQIKQPDANEVREYFEQNKELFRQKKLKIDEIWCEDLATGKKIKALVDEGKDFEELKKGHALDKETQAREAFPGGESFLWKDLWRAEPNDVVGPVKGFYKEGIKWRVVKILEKDHGKIPDFSEGLQRQVKEKMVHDRRIAALEKYSKELLDKYEHEIYQDKIKDIDPLNVP